MPFLVAIDLSAPSRHAIEVAALLARASGLEPLLLHVAERDPNLGQLAALYELAEPLRALGSNPSLRTVEGEPAACICAQAVARGCAFVVMGTHGRRDPAAQGPGSVARSVMARARVPVIAVRPHPTPPADPTGGARATVALVENGTTSPAAARVAGMLVRAIHGRLVRILPQPDRHGGLLVQTDASMSPSHLVLPVDPARPAPPWVERLLQQEPVPVVLVSDLPFGGGVPDATPLR